MSKYNLGDIIPASAMGPMNCDGIVVHLSTGKAHVLPMSSLIEIPDITAEPASNGDKATEHALASGSTQE
jgi:hypothetical protein